MKIFLDTAEIDEIRAAARWGLLDGVATNPSLLAKVGGSYDEVLIEICQITPGPVSAEVVSRAEIAAWHAREVAGTPSAQRRSSSSL